MTQSSQEGVTADISGNGRETLYPVADLRAYLAGAWTIQHKRKS